MSSHGLCLMAVFDNTPQAYTEAVEALGALSDRLKGSGGPFLFGSKPSSLDALLFGHVAFYLHSPIAAPVLKTKVRMAAVSDWSNC